MNPLVDLVSGAVQGFGKAVKDVVGSFVPDPTKAAELIAQIDIASKQLEGSLVTAVNTTMQAEAKSEHILQWAWRPTFGLTGAGILVNNYILLPYFSKFGIVPIAVPTEVWLMLMAVLGVAAWTRGQEKIEKLK